MRTPEQIQAELTAIDNFLQVKVPLSDITALLESMAMMIVYMASTASLVADAELLYNNAKELVYRNATNTKDDKGKLKPPSLVKDYIASRCGNEQRLSKYADRINAAITHALDATRTIISAEKSVAYASNYSQSSR